LLHKFSNDLPNRHAVIRWQQIWKLCSGMRLSDHLQAIIPIILYWLWYFLYKEALLLVFSLNVIPLDVIPYVYLPLFREHLIHGLSHLHLSRLAPLGF
jgi:hypothetical protein